MEWLVSVFTGFLGWLMGHLESVAQRRRGIEEGAHAALLGFEYGLNPGGPILPTDKELLNPILKNVAMHDPEAVRKAAEAAGEAYRSIIRRDALEDCQRSYFSDIDRAEWKRTFGKEMPPLAYDQGYLQAIKDVISGATDRGRDFFEADDLAEMMDWLDKTQREFSGEPAFIYLGYKPDGKLLGAELLSQTVVHTFRRADAEQTGPEAS
jgi:hypothetical protein